MRSRSRSVNRDMAIAENQMVNGRMSGSVKVAQPSPSNATSRTGVAEPISGCRKGPLRTSHGWDVPAFEPAEFGGYKVSPIILQGSSKKSQPKS